MDAAAYVELHCHSASSLLDGASTPDELVTRAAQLGYRALALTDHDGLYGAMEFAQAARAADITPITGAEITLADGSHLTLLAESRTGYANLCRLLTHIHHMGPLDAVSVGLAAPDHSADVPAVTSARASLGEYAEGLILLTGCRQGQLARLVDAGMFPHARTVLQQYIAWFGLVNVIVYPDLYVRTASSLLVEGRLQRRDGNSNVLASRCWPLDGVPLASPRGLASDVERAGDDADPRMIHLSVRSTSYR